MPKYNFTFLPFVADISNYRVASLLKTNPKLGAEPRN